MSYWVVNGEGFKVNDMLKLLAVQVIKGCKEHIKRCLEPELMYYLCYDYEISQSLDGIWHVRKRDAYLNNIDERFYRLSANSKLNINISAIVGENGSGKSTIVELILRMINNCAIRFGIRAEEGWLEYVNGVCARLFYMDGTDFYCLSMEDVQESVSVAKIAMTNHGDILPVYKLLTEEDLRGHFFYTLVSNYSHYAYNTHDFRKEWQKQSDEDTCWLKWLFHKNDGYQTPITLHPFRDQGTVSIEREKNLSNQRLLYFFINYAKRKDEGDVFGYINGKKPKYLNLQEVMSSKLQQVTLLRYFDDNKNVMLLGDQIEFVTGLSDHLFGKGGNAYKDFMGDIFQPLEILAYKTLGLNKPENIGHHCYFEKMAEWVKGQESRWRNEHQSSLFSGNSDLKQLLNAIDNMWVMLPKDDSSKVKDLCTLLRPFDFLNLCQIQRLEILDDVCDFWRGYSVKDIKLDLRFDMKLDTIISEYQDLSLKEKCYHYIVYKTIDILETYPSYHYPIWNYSNMPVNFSPSQSGNEKKQVFAAFHQILQDVTEEKTHITLKMRQAFYYLKHSIFDQGNEQGYVLTGEKVDGIEGICLSAERLADFYQNEDEQNLETLPPPIYERRLLFETVDGKLVDMVTFSSGEKQLLNTQSAIIYHLQNLSSISKDPVRMKYPQVNIILEEIELYFHPEYQRSFVYSLINLLEHSGISDNIKDVNILIVTHSPFILSDVSKSHVLFLKDGKPSTDMQENTFGSNIHSMLKNGFFLPSLPIGEFAHQKINGLFEKLNNAQVDRESGEERRQLFSDIARVGEPYLREQLMRLYNMYYPTYYHDRPE